MGRPRKPVSLLKDPKRKRLLDRVAELQLPASSPGEPPAWMAGEAWDEARELWRRLCDHPQYSQVLNAVHRNALIHYCVLHQRMVDDARGVREMSASERQTYNSLSMQFACTPAAATKVKMPGAQKPEESKWAATKPIPMSKRA